MKKTSPTLADLRMEIDAIDDQLHKLLKARADVVHTVRKVKGKQPLFIRPGREASMVRALLRRPAGRIPPGLLMRIWREMIGAFTMQEGRLTVAVAAGRGAEDLWDITRDYYGSSTPLAPCASAARAFAQLAAGKTQVAALPLPVNNQKKPWWLALRRQADLKIFAQFPFDLADAGRTNWRGVKHGAWAVARLAPEPTGHDHGLLLVWGGKAAGAAAVRRVLQTLKPLALHHDAARSCWLVTLDGLVDEESRKLAAAREKLAALGVSMRDAGGYAVPIGR